ncbi:MAG: peptidase M23 [Desulfuromonas sp.]|nr:MAG: peptidase M23 [Desulfuromonas sp.]
MFNKSPFASFFRLLKEGRLPARKFTVLIIPEGSHRVRRFSLQRTLVKAIAVAGVALVLGGCLLVADYLRVRVDRGELEYLRVHNRSQEQDLHRLAAKVEDLRQEMVVLAQNDAKVRVMAQLTRPKGDSLTGVGGPPEADAVAEFSHLQQQIDDVRRAIDLRRESQEEIRGVLNDQSSLLAAKPVGWPVKGWMTSSFGMRRSPFTGKRKMHEGLDIAARTGTPIYATADGIVSQAGTRSGYGKLVVVEHGYGYKTYYGHNSKIFVQVGQRLKRGDKIAAVGNTGRSTGPHLHYEVHLNGVPLNPKKYL